jgi:hypothetical protein
MPTIAKRLLLLARRIGRWILERLSRRGVTMLIGYMSGKVDDFRRRLAAAKKRGNARRVGWLTGRISRWSAAVRFLVRHQQEILDSVIREAEALASRLPLVSDLEREAA